MHDHADEAGNQPEHEPDQNAPASAVMPGSSARIDISTPDRALPPTMGPCTITDHNHISLPGRLRISCDGIDAEKGGGASHVYIITAVDPDTGAEAYRSVVQFQRGPVNENGVNGNTMEAYLAIIIHRLCQFQSGPFACEQNGRALVHLNEALAALHDRTTDRCARGVEGTSQR